MKCQLSEACCNAIGVRWCAVRDARSCCREETRGWIVSFWSFGSLFNTAEVLRKRPGHVGAL